MDAESDDDLIASIAPDVIRCLHRAGFFAKLDDVLCPTDDKKSPLACDGTYKISVPILLACDFDQADVAEIFCVLKSKGGCCDCEILYNVADVGRLKARYWRNRAGELEAQTWHRPKHSG